MKTQTDSRKFSDWIQGFIDATAQTATPEIFRRWAAISCLSGALERRVWVRTKGSDLYPNLYVVLVSRPGVGKTEVTDRVRLLWEGVKGLHVASANLSRASLADELNDAKVITPGNEYNALVAAVNELGTLLPRYNGEFMSALTDLYDCKVYTERKRGNKLNIKIDSPYLSMIAGTQPGYLQTLLPEVAWEQGFMSRCILVFSGEKILTSLFDIPQVELDNLAKDLLSIRKMKGVFSWTDEAKIFINEWHMNDGPPRPSHPKLSNYCTRRTAHLLKLTQIACANQGPERLIELNHIQTALDWMIEAEAGMEDIFKAMQSGGDSSVISDTMHYLITTHVRHGRKPIARTRVIAFLTERTDTYKVRSILDMMEQSGMLKPVVVEGKTAYIPQAKGVQ